MSSRITREQFLIRVTMEAAMRGTCLRAKVGCVIARHGRIVTTGYNGAPPGQPHCIEVGCQMEEGHCIRTIHAEANAIAFAARYGISVEDCTLYTYGWNAGICHRCRKIAMSAGIAQLVEVLTIKTLVLRITKGLGTPHEEISNVDFGLAPIEYPMRVNPVLHGPLRIKFHQMGTMGPLTSQQRLLLLDIQRLLELSI